jgi:hypothetical protein
VQGDVEADGDLPLELANGFKLVLRDVLYVPYLQRNVLIVILEMENVRYFIIKKVLVLLFKRKTFICYRFVKM